MEISVIQYLVVYIEDREVTDIYIDVSPEFVFDELKKAV